MSVQAIEVTDVVIGIGETFDIEMILPKNFVDFDIRIELFAECRGLTCDRFHIPFVDIRISRSQKRINNIGRKLDLLLPSQSVKAVEKCKPIKDGKCSVFNCPWLGLTKG